MEKFSLVGLLVALVVGFSAMMVCLLQFAWNAAVVPTFGAPSLSFWQTWGCMLIISFIGSCFKAATKSK